RTLEDLRSDRPRFRILQDLASKAKPSGPAGELLAAAVTIDITSTGIINYCLSQSASLIPATDKRWFKLAKALEGIWPIERTLVVRLVGKNDNAAQERIQAVEAALEKMNLLSSTLGVVKTMANTQRKRLRRDVGREK